MPGLPEAAIIVVMCVVGLDRATAAVFRRRLADVIRRSTRAASRPAVKLARAPFLPQFLTGRIGGVDVRLAEFTVGGLEFRGARASLRQVRLSRRPRAPGRPRAAVRAGHAAATAIIGYSAIAARLPPGLRVRPGAGDLRLTGTIMRLPVAGTISVRIEREQIMFTPKVIGVPSLVGFAIRLPGLPTGVELTSARVTEDGLEVTARGARVVLSAWDGG